MRIEAISHPNTPKLPTYHKKKPSGDHKKTWINSIAAIINLLN